MLLKSWDRPALRTGAERSLLLSALLLPLSAAATVDLGFTMTLSYLLGIVAVVLGAPSVIRGALRLPSTLVAVAGLVLLVYASGVVIGSDLGLSDQIARSRFRDVVYLVDLCLGMALVALIVDIVARGRVAIMLAASLCAGATAVAGYAIYQWFALHYGWPAGSVNNALNSDGVTRGALYQGAGILGWERVRGTFKEPLFLASHLVIALPLTYAIARRSSGRRRTVWRVAAGTIATALMLTASSLAVGALFVATLAVCCVWAVRRGAIRRSAVLGATTALVLLLAPVVFVDPSVLSGATGRSKEDLRVTSANRISAWSGATTVWSQRPVLGFGPGQSSIRLSYRPDLGPGVDAPLALGSAQGLWAASLVDVGLLGFSVWLAFFGAAAAAVYRALAREPNDLLIACAISGCAAVVLGNMSADRLDIRTWFALGLALAAACLVSQRMAGDGDEDPDEGADRRPASRGHGQRAAGCRITD